MSKLGGGQEREREREAETRVVGRAKRSRIRPGGLRWAGQSRGPASPGLRVRKHQGA